MRQIETEFEQGNFHETMALLEHDTIAAWFGLRTERLIVILETLIRAGVDETGLARSLYTFVGQGSSQKELPPTRKMARSKIPPLQLLMQELSAVFVLRMRGDVVKANQLSKSNKNIPQHFQPVFDSRRGWALFYAVQQGITSMLAGDNQKAIQLFKTGQMHVFVPSLSFITRDAYAKEALIQAAYGDQEYAAKLLQHARKIPQTGSWVEQSITASEKVAAAMLYNTTTQGAQEILENIPIRDVGETWAYYLLAQQNVHQREKRNSEFEQLITTLESMPFPRIDGQGHTGSVFHIIKAENAIEQQEYAQAQQLLKKADYRNPATLITAATIELAMNNPTKAVEYLQNLTDKNIGLRQSELKQYVIQAEAYEQLGKRKQALQAMQNAASLPGGLKEPERAKFSQRLQALASQYIPGWVTAEPETNRPFNTIKHKYQLTDRECEILRQHVAHKEPLFELSERLYVSEDNTRKHLQTIYRKLNITTRENLLTIVGTQDFE